MYLGEYTLFDILKQNGEEVFQICVITFDIKEPLNHSLTLNNLPLEGRTPDSCKEHNDGQVSSINQFIEKVKDYLSANPNSTKRKSQLEYLSNTLDHFVNWYEENQLPFPDTATIMPNKIGIFSANRDFSIISIRDTTFRLRESQSKIVQVLYESADDGVDGLTYPEIARRTGLTTYSKMSNYFQARLRVKDLLKYSKQNQRYSLITE
tara:strand:+ start:210 stop:833 length:624 start_codon:yes stop_codon:yes gene_type:complete